MPNDRNRPAQDRSSPDRATRDSSSIDARVALLEEVLIHYARTGTFENTLGHGLDAVSGQLCGVTEQLMRIAHELQPLRRLNGGEPVELTDDQEACWANLQAAQARASFREVKALPLHEVSLRFASDLPQLPAPDHAIDPSYAEEPTWSAAS
jgi:hypothetical protein